MKTEDRDLDDGNQIVWSIIAISTHLSRIGDVLGKQIGVSAPQWMMLSVLETLNGGRGASVKDIARILQVDSSFVSAQARLLQNENLIRRSNSKKDRRVVILSLTEEARTRMAPASRNRDRLQEFVQGELGEEIVNELSSGLRALQLRTSRAYFLASSAE